MSRLSLSSYGASTIGDFGYLFCGERLGQGIGREVFVLATDPTKVVKIETQAQSFQNILEWEAWHAAKDGPTAKWLAPCHFISPSGIVLIMDRTQPLRRGEEPDRMPVWLTDFKRTNYGLLNGRVVCHDYGTARALDRGIASKAMKSVKWWDA